MTRPEIIVYRSEYWNCFFTSTDGGVNLLNACDPQDGGEEVFWWKPSRIDDLREVWRSGPES